MVLQSKKFISKMQDYLDSDSPGAKATKIVLVIIALAALSGVAITAPNIFAIFKKNKRYKNYSVRKYHDVLSTVTRGGYIQKSTGAEIKMTIKGNAQLQRIILEDIKISKPKRWDGKWRLFLFDIPVRFKKGRDALRWKIKDLGFVQFQKSVWIYPYPCEEEIDLVASYFGVTKHVDLFTVHNLPREQEFKKRFGL